MSDLKSTADKAAKSLLRAAAAHSRWSKYDSQQLTRAVNALERLAGTRKRAKKPGAKVAEWKKTREMCS